MKLALISTSDQLVQINIRVTQLSIRISHNNSNIDQSTKSQSWSKST